MHQPISRREMLRSVGAGLGSTLLHRQRVKPGGAAAEACKARRTGRTEQAVTVKRNRASIPTPWAWTEAQIALLGTLPDAEVVRRIGRTAGAVCLKRCLLGT